jgi:colanic acid biosynthesis glycosyl transferase WcaI
VTVLTQLFPPETQAGANRMGAMVDALSEEFDVTVVTLHPSYPNPGFFEERGWSPEEDDMTPFRICRVLSFEPHSGSFLHRGLREAGMAIRLARHATRHPADLVLASSPSFFLGPAGLHVARRLKIPLVWDIRDVTWRYVAELGAAAAPTRWFGDWMGRIARAVSRRSSLIVGSNEGIVSEMKRLGIVTSCVTIPNGVSAELLKACESLEPSSRRIRRRVTYAGALGFYQGLETLIHVATSLPHVEFVIAGDGPERTFLEREAARMSANNVRFPGYLDRQAVLQLYADSDVLYASLRNIPSLRELTVPSKPYEYMAAGKPIVFVGDGVAAEALSASGACIILSGSDIAELAEAIDTVLIDGDLASRLGQAGLAYARVSTREMVMSNFTEGLRRWFMTI